MLTNATIESKEGRMWKRATVGRGAWGCGNVWQAVNLCQSPKRSYAQATTSLRLVPSNAQGGGEGKRVGCGLTGSRHSLDPGPGAGLVGKCSNSHCDNQIAGFSHRLRLGLRRGAFEAHWSHFGGTMEAHSRASGCPGAIWSAARSLHPMPCSPLSALCCIASIMCANK